MQRALRMAAPRALSTTAEAFLASRAELLAGELKVIETRDRALGTPMGAQPHHHAGIAMSPPAQGLHVPLREKLCKDVADLEARALRRKEQQRRPT